MPAETGQSKVAKRSSNACTRCRRQKIRCSGRYPCDNCEKRGLHCELEGREQRITVSRAFIEDLQRRVEDRPGVARPFDGRRNTGTPSDHALGLLGEASGDPTRPPLTGTTQVSTEAALHGSIPGTSREASPMANPLAAGKSTFRVAPNGRTLYLGTSSNWAFARRILDMTHEHLYNAPLPTDTLAFDSCTYDLGWSGCRTGEKPHSPSLPTLDYALHLLHMVKFHCGQIFHLFDEDTFKTALYQFYAQSHPLSQIYELCQGDRPPGVEFFVMALFQLPETSFQLRDPLLSTEILCCIALYLQCIDYRLMAHNYIGQAQRMALGQGMHTDMPHQTLGDAVVERSRRAFWTVYILDREIISLVGLPHCVHDDDLYPALPTFSELVQQRAALVTRVQLSRAIAHVDRTVYGADGRLDSKFLRSTKNVLAEIAGVADELRNDWPLHLDNDNSTGVSRIAAHLHLLYHQCIILASRPVLFCFMKLRLKSPETCSKSLKSFRNVRNLIQMCSDSSIQTLNILGCLQSQGLIETFLLFDLQATFIASINILASVAVDRELVANHSVWLQRGYALFDELTSSGNLLSKNLESKVRHLENMLPHLSEQEQGQLDRVLDQPTSVMGEPNAFVHPAQGTGSFACLPPLPAEHSLQGITPTSFPDVMGAPNFDDAFTSAQILAMADSIDTGDTEWMSQAVLDYNIW